MHFPSHMICNISQSSHGAMNSYSAFNENNQKDPAHLPYFNKLDWEQEINGGGGKQMNKVTTSNWCGRHSYPVPPDGVLPQASL